MKKYKVLVNDKVVAESMTIRTAATLMKALLYEETEGFPIAVNITEMERCEGEVCENG